jgi:hypothetical protein
MHPTIRSLMRSAAVLAVCTACGAGGARTPQEPDTSTARIKAEHQAWGAQVSAFLDRAAATIADAKLLRDHPGWPDLERIARARPALRRFEGEAAAREKTATALVGWGQRWNASGERLLRHYDALVEQSQRLETERLRLIELRHEVWKHGRDGITREVATARSGAELQAASARLGRWDRLRDEELEALALYGPDALGLYRRRPG